MDKEKVEIKKMYACPFDRSHLIPKDKLLKHIQKCKAPTRALYSPCPYNPYHWINPNNLEAHQRQCEFKSNNKITSSFLDYEPQNNVLPNSSIISQIQRKSQFYQESMQEIAINFQLNLYPQNVPTINKKINKKELKDLNRDRVWREPDFKQWMQSRNRVIECKKKINTFKSNVHDFLEQDSF